MMKRLARSYNSLPWVRSHKFKFFLLVIFLLIVGVFFYEKIALELNKRAFQQARTSIDTVYADIVAQVGQPDSYKRSNSCSRPNQEFTQGPLSCNVATTMIYGVSNPSEANTKFKSIQTIVNSKKIFKPTSPPADTIRAASVGVITSSTALDHYTINSSKMDCAIKYVYDTPSETSLLLKMNTPEEKAFYISIGCDDWARAQYYPKNN